jgi:hypothetical protein
MDATSGAVNTMATTSGAVNTMVAKWQPSCCLQH